MITKLKLATIWLSGCSGCHMSFLDTDEWLIDLAARVEVVYSPLVDAKVYPRDVDVALVEGAVANDDHLRMIGLVRARTKLLISFGDCAISGNATALRNPLGAPEALVRLIYAERADAHGRKQTRRRRFRRARNAPERRFELDALRRSPHEPSPEAVLP
ncbi:MAG TPA: hypothetical protein PLO33_15250 [Kouleothrix sp.]|nr:hypothetical protein [Kouleothrix sp.]